MDRPAMDSTDFASARTHMVDSQVRPNKVTDRRILDAMRRLPRETFVPASLSARAYADEDVPLGNGRVLLEPMVMARLAQAADVRPGEKVLVVAAGGGYGAALLAAMGAKVTALEEDPALLAIARAALAGTAGVELVQGRLTEGWPAGGPYDLVFVEAAAEVFPPALTAQAKPEGRLVGIRVVVGRVGQAVIGTLVGGELLLRPLFDCASPPAPAFRAPAGFVF
jgi:protein-L-isoaspartate(D-aspartate) O-methyltransferase